MRFASYFTAAGVPTWGVEVDGNLYDLGPTGHKLANDLTDAIIHGALPESFTPAAHEGSVPSDSARYLPVLTRPAKILCIGVNYRSHQDETGRRDAPAPVVFTRFADTLAAAGEDLPIPPETEQYDYEGELAIVIGKPADHITQEGAWDVVAGYAALNDLSARDWQRHTGQWVPGKNFRHSAPFGPFFVPATDVPDISRATVQTRVNGDTRQHATVGDLIFSIPELVEYCTTFTPLSPGDVIVTGTPGGVGLFREPPTFLRTGDVVEVEITGLGVLRNRMI